MSYQPTFKRMIRTCLILIGTIISVNFIFLTITNELMDHIVLLSAMGAIIVLMIGVMNIYLLGFQSARNPYARQTLKQKSLRYFYSYLISPIIYIIVWIPFEPFLTDDLTLLNTFRYVLIFTLSSWLMNTLVILIYNYDFLHHSKIHSEMENLKLKAIVSETSNQVLKQQIHPHFLFNVLNTVKTLYKQDIHQGETYLVHLANFLRASLSNTTARIVTLESELQLCEDYIEMQRIRFGVALTYQVELPVSIRSGKFVPYFAIQTLLENAIKHNDLTEESPLNISVASEGDSIVVTNNYQPRHFKEPSTGQGLPNLSERYRLLIGEEIQIAQNEKQFTVKIKLLDNEDSHH